MIIGKKKIGKKIYFSPAFMILALFAVYFFSYFKGYPGKQFAVALISSFLYFYLGMLYHYCEGDLHVKIVIEYLLIALLAILFSYFAF